MKLNGNLRQDTLYNLGAYDTVDTSNADYDLITRRTGYIKGQGDWQSDTQTTGGLYRKYIYINGRFDVVNDEAPKSNIYSNVKVGRYLNPNTPEIGVSLCKDTTGYYIGYVSSTELTSAQINELGIFVEYLLQTEYQYTEKVIKNQPLNTLDQNGSQWVRNEYEKTLNLVYDIEAYCNIGTTGALGHGSANEYNVFIARVEEGKTYSFNGDAQVRAFYTANPLVTDQHSYNNSRETGTISNPFVSPVTGWVALRFPLTTTALMLNEGSVALPYQPYHGEIVHKVDVEPALLWENNISVGAAWAGQTITVKDMSNYNYIVIEMLTNTYDTITRPSYVEKVQKLITSNDVTISRPITDYTVRRSFAFNSNTSITIGNCTLAVISDGSTQTDNKRYVPLRIWGTNNL